MRFSPKLALLIAVVFAIVVTTASAASVSGRRVFYLDLKSGACVRGVFSHKTMLLLPCSDPSHNLEVYAVLHGGWKRGHEPSHATVYGRARFLCTSKFRSRFGHALSAPYGWRAFWPDPGKEEEKYGDRLICGLAHYPQATALGAGTHFT